MPFVVSVSPVVFLMLVFNQRESGYTVLLQYSPQNTLHSTAEHIRMNPNPNQNPNSNRLEQTRLEHLQDVCPASDCFDLRPTFAILLYLNFSAISNSFRSLFHLIRIRIYSRVCVRDIAHFSSIRVSSFLFPFLSFRSASASARRVASRRVFLLRVSPRIYVNCQYR